VQKFGAKVFTDGLQHAMKLPYHEFEDQRSGETLSILQKVRTDTENFIKNFVNILFTVVVGIAIVAIFSFRIHPWLPVIYFGGIAVLMLYLEPADQKVKTIQKCIVSQPRLWPALPPNLAQHRLRKKPGADRAGG
jgi:ATP-binding cassette subfamily B protein